MARELDELKDDFALAAVELAEGMIRDGIEEPGADMMQTLYESIMEAKRNVGRIPA